MTSTSFSSAAHGRTGQAGRILRRRTVRVAALAALPLALVPLFAWFNSLPESSKPRPAGTERGVYAASGSDAREARERNSMLDDDGALKRTEARAPSEVQTISDEELFALFPNRALALIDPPRTTTIRLSRRGAA